jgi:hypothetical protein
MVLKDYQKENLRATNFYKDSRGLGFKPAGRQATGRLEPLHPRPLANDLLRERRNVVRLNSCTAL